MRKIIIGFIILACAFVASSKAYAGFWVDNWTNGSYYATNSENPNFRSFLLRSEGRFGFQPTEDFSAMPYIVYYGAYGQDTNYWNNNIAYGVGLRAYPFTSFKTDSYFLDWIPDVKIYSEILSIAFLKGDASAEANGVKRNDFRVGFDVWHEWNLQKPDTNMFWGELWSNLTYRNTNFYDTVNFSKFDTYVGYMQLKVGRHIAGVKPYAAAYLQKAGSPKAWLNSLTYGLGIRMEPFLEQEGVPPLLQKFKIYAEALSISWLAEQDPARPSSDFRFGFEFTQGR